LRVVDQAHGVGLDGDAALALDIHRIEHLLLHLALLERAGHLDEPVGERRFAVVDMGDDGEVADVFQGCVGHGAHIGTKPPARKPVFRRPLTARQPKQHYAA
jgi:hypothetical protein